MDELAETELHEATAGLGNWHSVDDKLQYLVNRDECISCLQDLQIALKHDVPEAGGLVHLKLGEWKVMANHLVPLFTSYREDGDISGLVLRVMVQLTTHADLPPSSQLQHLQHLQDYKEAFAKTDVFIILMGLLVETMEEEEESTAAPAQKKDVFEGVLALLRNLVSVPDPRPGDAGFTPTRRHLQLIYIRHFHDEGVLDFFLLFAEALAADQNAEQAWALADILYHVCTHLDPEELNKSAREKHKRVLADLLAREQADARLRIPQASRHSRFGTALQTRTAQGGISVSTSVFQTSQVNKGGALWRREFRDRDTEKKRSMFHDPFFVDLEEGSVRDHNQLNAHVRSVLDSAKTIGDGVLQGLRKFFEEFMQTCFSTLVGLLRSSLTSSRQLPAGVSRDFGRPTLLNFLAWTLEFHRHHYLASLQRAKDQEEQAPIIDIASIQGAIDLDMLQFLSARLREYGKGCNIHASHLVVVLRALSQQVKTISLVMESKDSDTRDCGEILTQNIVKDDVMGNLAWVLKNFTSSTQDPRVLSYSVEIFHIMLRLMSTVAERQGQGREFRVERQTGLRMQRLSTTAAKEVASLAHGKVIENLFYLLEKYKRQSSALTSMLVKLIYRIISVRPTNIVVFFELSYFTRIFRICSDPLLYDKKMGGQYKEMMSLLQYIIRQFFKCAEINGCVFVELLFRKVITERGDPLLESHTSEFQAILDNYEDEEYKSRILDRIAAGETLEAARSKQKAALDGQLPWKEEEDAMLRERHPMYADHPLCAELLAAELPEESHRTARQIRKRLVELGLVRGPRADAGRGPQNDRADVESNVDDSQPDFPLALKKKRAAEAEEATAAGATAVDPQVSQESEVTAAKRRRVEQLSQHTDEETLEMDLERLLDAAMDADGDTFQETEQDDSVGKDTRVDVSSARKGAQDEEMPAADSVEQPQAGNLDLEAELADLLDEGGVSASPQNRPAASAASQEMSPPPPPPVAAFDSPNPRARGRNLEDSPDWVQRELDAMLGEGTSSQHDDSLGLGNLLSSPARLPQPETDARSQQSSQGGLERDLAAVMEDDAPEVPSQLQPPRQGASPQLRPPEQGGLSQPDLVPSQMQQPGQGASSQLRPPEQGGLSQPDPARSQAQPSQREALSQARPAQQGGLSQPDEATEGLSQKSSQGGLERDLAAVMEEGEEETQPAQLAEPGPAPASPPAAVLASQQAQLASQNTPARQADASSQAPASQDGLSASQQLERDLAMIIDEEGGEEKSGDAAGS